MSMLRCGLTLLTWAAFAACQDPGAAVAPPATTDAPDRTPSDFVRFVAEGDGGHLDTAITTYRRGAVTLQLFGAVHIADVACYQELNDRFTDCDVLLYELVADPEGRSEAPPPEASRFQLLGLLQQGLKNSLQLAFQLDEIDYQAPNFVHADMTPAEFAASMAERGESLLSVMLKMMQSGMQLQQQQADGAAPPTFDLVQAFRQREGRHTLRLGFARQMEQIEALAAGGQAGGTLLEGRNEKCLEVLQRELTAGRTRIGIYYGAAHFPHLERRLVEDLGFRKVGHEWLVAWDCKKRVDERFDRAESKRLRTAREELLQLVRVAQARRLAQPGGEPPPVATLVAAAGAGTGGEPGYPGPVQDPWGTDYVLQKRATGRRWQAVSAGPDRTLGTADDLVLAEPRRGGPIRR
jgi:hypothetical protein